MQTTYVTLTAREVLAAEGTSAAVPARRRLVCLSARETGEGPSGDGKIINFSDWASREAPVFSPEPEDQEDASEAEPRRDAAGGRRWMQVLLQVGELLATCSVIGVMALLIVRLLAG